MIVLVNYNPWEYKHINPLCNALGKMGVSYTLTSKSMTISEFEIEASKEDFSAALIINATTLKNLVGDDSVTLDNWRGSRIDGFAIPCIVCNALHQITSTKAGAWILYNDLMKLKFLDWRKPGNKRNIVMKVDQLPEFVSICNDSLLMAVDIETTGESASKEMTKAKAKASKSGSLDSLDVTCKEIYITSISFSVLTKAKEIVSFSIPFTGYNKEVWEQEEFKQVWLALKEVLEYKGTPKVLQNGLYDLLYLIRYRLFVENYFLDTMGMMHAQYAELPKSLDFISSIYFPFYKQWKYKSKEAAAGKNLTTLLDYNMDDTYYTLLIAIFQLLFSEEYVLVNNAMTFKLVYPSLYCDFKGFKVDNELRLNALHEAQAKKEKAKQQLQLIAGDDDYNPGSSQQTAFLVFNVLGAKHPGVGKGKTGVDAKNRVALARQHPFLARVCKHLDDYAEAAKAISTYFCFYQRLGYLLYHMNPWGTDTMRQASTASNFNCGTQFQNIPKYGKKMLVPDDGFVIINADFSKAEAVCTAHIAVCQRLIEAVSDQERDFYKNLAVIFFHMAYEDVSKEFRNKVLKKIVHGTNYVMGAKTFTENMGLEHLIEGAKILGIRILPSAPRVQKGKKKQKMRAEDFSSYLIELYHSSFPEIRRWYAKTSREVVANGRLTGITGWTRIFFGDPRTDFHVFSGAVAHQPQNLSVSLLNEAERRIYDRLVTSPNWVGDYRLNGQVHDSIVAQVIPDRLEEALETMDECMTLPIKMPNVEKSMCIRVDFEISSKSYGQTIELEKDKETGKFIIPKEF